MNWALSAAFYSAAFSAQPAAGSHWILANGSSSYVTVESSSGIRNVITITNQTFQLRPKGPGNNIGLGSHEGGLISVKEAEQYFLLRSVGVIIPKENQEKFNAEGYTCRSYEAVRNTISVTCDDELRDRSLNYVISKEHGVLSFTGFCYITANQLCNYILTSRSGISLQRVR